MTSSIMHSNHLVTRPTIAITYDLKSDYLAQGYSPEQAAEFDSIETVEAIERALLELGYNVERVGGIKSLVERLARKERWDLVFNFCEGAHGIAREAQVPCLLDAYQIPYVFSDPSVLALALDKGLTKLVLKNNGVPTAPFTILNSTQDLKFLPGEFPLFVKPLAEGSSKGIHETNKVNNSSELEEVCKKLFAQDLGPLLLETYLPGEEFTVGILGTGFDAEVLGVMSIARKDGTPLIYSFDAKKNFTHMLDYKLVGGNLAERVSEVALRSWRILGGRDCGRVDIRLDHAGVPNFIEVNTLPGMHPTDSDIVWISNFVGVSYQEMIRRVINSALVRVQALTR